MTIEQEINRLAEGFIKTGSLGWLDHETKVVAEKFNIPANNLAVEVARYIEDLIGL